MVLRDSLSAQAFFTTSDQKMQSSRVTAIIAMCSKLGNTMVFGCNRNAL